MKALTNKERYLAEVTSDKEGHVSETLIGHGAYSRVGACGVSIMEGLALWA